MEQESDEEFVARLRSKAKENLEEKLSFGEKLVVRTRKNNGLTPFPGQIMRVYEAIENGTKKILFADSTGFGKTYVACMILGLLNETKNKRHKTLLIAPGQSMQTAWTQKEINSYLSGLGLLGTLNTIELDRCNLDDISNSLKGKDIVYVNYHKFDCATSDKYVEAVLKIAPKTDLIIFDEGHNNKGFGKRGDNIKRLIDKTRNKRILQLTATPGYNGLEDLGIPLHILDPENFPFDKYDYNADPTAIKDMILSGQWFNSDRKVVAKLFDLPKITLKKPVYCDIGEYSRNYLEVWKDGDLGIGAKIALLRKFSLLGKVRSPEGKKCLEELLESFPKNHALVTFTHLKTGVSQELFEFLERFYGKNKVAMINGDVKDIKKRIEISKRFTDGEFKAIANSFLTMGEGVPCTTGDRPAKVLFLEMPYNHGQGDQGIGRIYRPRQEKNVDVYYILGKNDWLSSEMTKLVESGELEERYNIRFPRNWRASTIDLDIYEIMLQKGRIDVRYVRRGMTLSKIQKVIMEYHEESTRSKRNAEKAGILKSLPKKLRNEERESSISMFTRTNQHMYSIGEKEMERASRGEGEYKKESRYMVNAYTDKRIFNTTAGDTARLIKQVVEGLERRGVVIRDPLDLGCGTGIVSKVLEKDMTNLDLDERMLYPDRFYKGKEFFGRGPRKKGFMTNLPFENNSFDLITASYSIFYSQQRDNEREIEKILVEANRVLRDKGYFISSFIRTTKQEDLDKIVNAMKEYGFNVLISDFFKGYEQDNKRSKFSGTYLIVGRKEEEKKDYVGNGFSVYVPTRHFVSRGSSRVTLVEPDYDNKNGRIKEFKKVNSYNFKNRDGISLDEMLRNIK